MYTYVYIGTHHLSFIYHMQSFHMRNALIKMLILSYAKLTARLQMVGQWS